MAGLALSVAGIAVLVTGRAEASGALTWLDVVGASTLITGLLLWAAGVILRTLEL